MKKLFLFAILLSAAGVHAQSLKETLYSGKLKTDSGTVIRKGEDLSTKIDTGRKKPAEPEKVKVTTVVRDSVTGALVTQVVDSVAAAPVAEAPKDNNVIWKEYMDELITGLRTEVMTSKKVKDGTYSILIQYEIGLDGQVAINDVSCSPESSYLKDQVKERLTLTAPRMNPVLLENGKPRKATKKQMFTLAK